jgi:hypothetical protein
MKPFDPIRVRRAAHASVPMLTLPRRPLRLPRTRPVDRDLPTVWRRAFDREIDGSR